MEHRTRIMQSLEAYRQCDYVVVYGSLREGLGNSHFMEGTEFVKDATLNGFDMYPCSKYFDENMYPYCAIGNGEIKVSVYKLTKFRQMFDLDRLEGYPTLYNRMVVNVDGINCWIYYLDTNGVEGKNKINRLKDYKIEDGNWRGWYKEYLMEHIKMLYLNYKNLEELENNS